MIVEANYNTKHAALLRRVREDPELKELGCKVTVRDLSQKAVVEVKVSMNSRPKKSYGMYWLNVSIIRADSLAKWQPKEDNTEKGRKFPQDFLWECQDEIFLKFLRSYFKKFLRNFSKKFLENFYKIFFLELHLRVLSRFLQDIFHDFY